MNMQYKIPSQQCQSEVYQMNNNKNQNKYINENQNAYQNPLQAASNILQSNFDESFEKLFAPQNFDNLGALDPKDDMDDLPSISNIPIIRNQKSQATQRQTPDMPNQKLNLNQYNNNPMHLNYSQSEIYDNQSTSNIYEINSQLNEIQIQAAVSQVSQDSNDSGNKDLVPRNDSYLSKREGTSHDENHPFTGPKLHLFRKGQSKSSQLKQRKVKTSGQNQRLLEMNSMQNKNIVKLNPVYSQHSGVMGHPHYQPQQQLLSEGGAIHAALLKKPSKSKNGHINISEILNGNFQSGLLAGAAANNLGSIERMYTDNRSLDSQGVASQNSFEYIQAKEHQNPLDGDNSSLQYIQNVHKPHILPKIVQEAQPQHDLMAGMETRSQQCPSQFSTLQQKNIADESHDSRENLMMAQQYNIGSSQSVLVHDSSPYIANYNRSLGGKGVSKHVIQKIQEQQKSGMRPNTTNPGNPIFIDKNMQQTSNFVFKDQLQYQLNPQSQKITGTPNINFQHPKVGKNSKHPQVFKNQSNSSKTIQNKNISRQIISKNKLEPLENQKNNVIFGNIKGTEEDEGNQGGKQVLQPDQTGDFPSPREIRTYAADESEDYEGQNCQNVENAYKENAVINAGLQSLNSDREQEKFVSLLSIKKEESVYQVSGFQQQNAERNFKSRQGGPRSKKQEEPTTNITTAEVTVENEHPYSSYRSQDDQDEIDDYKIQTPNLPGIEPQSPSSSKEEPVPKKKMHKKNENSNESIVVDQLIDVKGGDQSESLEPSHGRSGSLSQQNLLNACSVAQTPCFAETPNTTDQFKNYKINDKGEISNSMQQTKIIINNIQQLQDEAAKNPQYSP